MNTDTALPCTLTPTLFDATIGPALELWIRDLLDVVAPDLPGLPHELTELADVVNEHDDLLLVPGPFIDAATDAADVCARLSYLQLLAAGGFTEPLPSDLRAPDSAGNVRRLTHIETVLLRLTALNARPKDAVLIGAQEALVTTVELGDRTAAHLSPLRELHVAGASGIKARTVELPAWTWNRLAELPSSDTERIAHDGKTADRNRANSTSVQRTQYLLSEALPYTTLKPKSLQRTAASNLVDRVGFDRALQASGMTNPDRFAKLSR